MAYVTAAATTTTSEKSEANDYSGYEYDEEDIDSSGYARRQLTATQHMVLKEVKALKAEHPVWRHEPWDFDDFFEGEADWCFDLSEEEESVGGISFSQGIQENNDPEVLRIREAFQQWKTTGKPDTEDGNTGFPDYYDMLYLPEGKIAVTERDLGILVQEAELDKDEDLAEYIKKHRAQTQRYHRFHLLIETEMYRAYRKEDELHQPNLSRIPPNGTTPRSTMQMLDLLEQFTEAKTNKNRAKRNRQRQNRRLRNQNQNQQTFKKTAVGLVPQSLSSKGNQQSIRRKTSGGHSSSSNPPPSKPHHHAWISTPHRKALRQQPFDGGKKQPAHVDNYQTMSARTQSVTEVPQNQPRPRAAMPPLQEWTGTP
jgi:hypothetical protein